MKARATSLPWIAVCGGLATKSPEGPGNPLRGACRPRAGPQRLLSVGLEFKHIFKHGLRMEGAGARRVGTGLLLQISLVNSPRGAGRMNTTTCVHLLAQQRHGEEK